MARGDGITGRTAGEDTQLARLAKDFGLVKQRLELLAGIRGDAQRSQSAVQRRELQALGSMALQSQQVSASPTQADFNALQADVAAIFKALQTISNVLGNATIPKL